MSDKLKVFSGVGDLFDMALFDSREFGWSQTEIAINGRIVTGIRGISYDVEQDKEAIFGKGSKPQAIGRGNVRYSGEITVLGSELANLIALAPQNNLLSVVAQVSVVYVDALGLVKKDLLVGVEFTRVAHSLKQGDMYMEVSLPIVFLDVKYNV